MKIVLIAGFSNAEIREHLEFKKDRNWYHGLIKLLGLPPRVGNFGDCGLWIRSLVSFFETQKDVELHVIGPHIRLKHPIETFTMRGVTYHFFATEWTEATRLIGNYRVWKWLQHSGYYTKKLLREIQPDIVLLSGSENPATSICAVYAKDYPTYCLCQTVYNNPERAKYLKLDPVKLDCERDVFRSLSYFGVYCKMHYDLLRSLKPNAVVFKFGYPTHTMMLNPIPTEKEFDFVNFALTLDLRKGAHDSIKALGLVKQKYPHVTLNLVGGCDSENKIELDKIIEELGLQENVIFTPFFEKRRDALLHIQKSRFAVLPCKLDNTSGTMSQSMQLGLPIVVYKTSGTSAYNRYKQCVLIAEKGDVEELAAHMISLLEKPELGAMLSKNAREYQEQKKENASHNGERLMANIYSIVANYREEKEIPQEQLFNPETND